MKYFNRIIWMIGCMVAFAACGDSKLPFPDAERATFITLEKIDEIPFLTSISDLNTEIRIGTKLHQFGGTEYAKVEIYVVRNPAADNYQTVLLAEITGGLSIDQAVVNSFKLSDIISKTGGSDIEGGEQFVFYYNLTMPDGMKTIGWSKPTGFATNKSLANIDEQVGYIAYNVVCGMSFDDLLGNWLYSDPEFIEDEWDVVATEDPDQPGAGLILTFVRDGYVYGEPGPDSPLKIGINMSNYKYSFPKQVFWADLGGYTNFSIGAASGDISTCGGISITFISPRTVDQGGWGNFPTIMTKVP